MDKRANEGIAWVPGLIAILIIIAASYIAYTAGELGKKEVVAVDVSLDDESSFSLSEFQRQSVYVVSSDFNGSNKGEILRKFYKDSDSAFPGISVNLPVLLAPAGYSPVVFVRYQKINFVNNFYLGCSHSSTKYLSFGLKRSKNGK